jgi:iron complex outermembrane receptor protein
MHQLYGRFDYDVTDTVQFFASLGGTFKRNQFYGDAPNLSNIVLNKNNAFLPASYAAQIPDATFNLSKIFNQAERFGAVPESRQLIFTTGLKGKLGDYDWNLGYTRGQTKLTTLLLNNVNNQKLSAALDAVTGTGRHAGLLRHDPGRDRQRLRRLRAAQPVRPDLGQRRGDGLHPRRHQLRRQDQPGRHHRRHLRLALRHLGRPGRGRAVGRVAPADLRIHQRRAARPVRRLHQPALQLRRHGRPHLPLPQHLPGQPAGQAAVWETAAEANVPLIKDVPLIQSFEVNGAARYTSYDTVGNYWTWKLGGDWHVNDDLRFRGTLSRDIRAPTLNDLYAPTSVVIVTNADLKTNTTNPLPSVNVANPGLTAEIGETKTVGLVYKPSFAPGPQRRGRLLRDQDQERDHHGPGLPAGHPERLQPDQRRHLLRPDRPRHQRRGHRLAGQADQPGGRRDQGRRFRSQLRRHAVRSPDHPARPGGLSAAHLLPPARGADDRSGRRRVRLHRHHRRPVVAPDRHGQLRVTDSLRVDLMQRWRNELKISGDPTVTFLNGEDDRLLRPDLAQRRLQLNNERLGKSEIFINVQNLFNAKPPPANATGSAAAPGGFAGFALTDDPIGRYFTVGFRMRL